MRKMTWLLASVLSVLSVQAEDACQTQAPCYTADSIVNAASFLKDSLAPNTLVAIFGSNLSYSTRAVTTEDVLGGRLPIQLAGVTVRIGGVLAPLYYVSAGQINALIPNNLFPAPQNVQVVRDGWAGPLVRIELSDVAPSLFVMDRATAVASRADFIDNPTAVASHEDFSVVTRDSPARPGSYLILWANGLGRVSPPLSSYADLPALIAWIERLAEFRVLFDGVPVDPERISYAGVAPSLAGVYQINIMLPESVGNDPEVRIAVGDNFSPPSVHVPLRPGN